MEKIEKQFAGVCSAYGTGLEHLKRTIDVYEALKKIDKPVRPFELAEFMHLGRYGNGYNRVVHPLHWLEAIGLVRREEHEETIELDLYCNNGHYETITKVIDGIEYKAQKWVEGPLKKVVKYYKWYVV